MAFWIQYMDKMPRLARLALVLLNIHVSSAFTERFFTIRLIKRRFIKICLTFSNEKIYNFFTQIFALKGEAACEPDLIHNLISFQS
ncbi:hypothetical protein BpHYR1_038627 [Brachionus plicatilis]|uniref:HAT C-terminal dimerisation domain-containing protein n=1 Tax=Brachionus plicatilis TaxID=10195 RepID=A0A3M7ST86_BRAPC|nr:hypothetical protein BpHYR1_038627 [Brachionus plicatilis]